MGIYRNKEGYPDPTVGGALSNIIAEEKLHETENLKKIRALLPLLKGTAEIAGFRIAGRITLIDMDTGKKYK